MRKQKPHSNFISYQDDRHNIIIGAYNHHFENGSANVTNSPHKSPGNLTISTTVSVTSCTWNECAANNGSTIYVDPYPTELEVHRCQFLSCSAITHTMEVQSMPSR